MKTCNALLLGLFVLISVTSANATGEKQQGAVIQTQRSKFKELYDRLDSVHICGRIVDLDGNPVPEAEVRISWSRATFLIGVPEKPTDTWIKSDIRGEWSFSLDKPDCIYVMGAAKEGYAFVNSDYACQELAELCRRTKGAPVVVRLRKKCEETFLVVNPRAGQNDKVLRLTSFHSGTNHLDVLADGIRRGAFKGYADISIAADYDPKNGWWKISCSATNGTDGIITSDELLYEAPSKGYEKQIVTNGPPWPKYVYVRSRTPAIYSRVNLDYYVWDGAPTNRVLNIYYKSWANPYGSRSLEHSKSIEQNWCLEKELKAEAKAAIEAKRYPPNPDIPLLIKAMKERIAKEEKDK